MPFQTRNPYYLRISERSVIPLYLYLDERHLEWMSDMVLQHVLADLRPHILPKLRTEVNMVAGGPSNTKKSTLDTHRGETYQFCYFFRKTEPHSIVVKTRNFVAMPPQKRPTIPIPPVPSSSKSQRGKRKSKSALVKPTEVPRKKRKTKGKGIVQDHDDEFSTSSNEATDDDFNPVDPRRSKRARKTPANSYQEIDDSSDLMNDGVGASTGQTTDVDMVDQTVSRHAPISEVSPSNTTGFPTVQIPGTQPLPTTTIEFEIIEEEEKPKPVLQLKYRGFNIYGHCLCVVVEPWPPIRSASRAPSVVTVVSREPSLVPPRRATAQDPPLRAKTPLFLPDDTEKDETPAPFRDRSMAPPAISSLFDPRFLDDSDSEDEGGMMLFSQVLNSTGDRAGAAEEDEDMDTEMFFSDADEVREL